MKNLFEKAHKGEQADQRPSCDNVAYFVYTKSRKDSNKIAVLFGKEAFFKGKK